MKTLAPFTFTAFLRDVLIGLSILLVIAWLSGCAASPDTLIYIDKSIYVEKANDVDLDYETNSGISSAAEFDGEVTPDIDTKITPR